MVPPTPVGSSDRGFVLLWGGVQTTDKCIAVETLGGIIGGISYFLKCIFHIKQHVT